MIGKKVLIRSYASGVHFGKLESYTDTLAGRVVELSNSRRVHYWEGAASLSQMANDGVNQTESRISQVLPSITIVNVIEIIPLSEKAIENLENTRIWQV